MENVPVSNTPKKRVLRRVKGVYSVRKNKTLGKTTEVMLNRASGDFDAMPTPLSDPVATVEKEITNGVQLETFGWTEQNKWLCMVKRLLVHHPETLVDAVDEVITTLNALVRNKRSKLCKNALQLYGLLFDTPKLRRSLANSLRVSLPLLLERASNFSLGSEFILSAAETCITNAIEKVSASRTLSIILNDKNNASNFFEVSSKQTRERIGEFVLSAFQTTVLKTPDKLTREMVSGLCRAICVLSEERLPRSRQLGERMLSLVMDTVSLTDILLIMKSPLQFNMSWAEVDRFKTIMSTNSKEPTSATRPQTATPLNKKRKRAPFRTLGKSPMSARKQKRTSGMMHVSASTSTLPSAIASDAAPAANLRRHDWSTAHTDMEEETHVLADVIIHDAKTDDEPMESAIVYEETLTNNSVEEAQPSSVTESVSSSSSEIAPPAFSRPSSSTDSTSTSSASAVPLSESLQTTLNRINFAFQENPTRETILDIGALLLQAANTTLQQSKTVLDARSGSGSTTAPPRYSSCVMEPR